MFTAAKTVKITDLNTKQVVKKFENDKKKIYSMLVADEYLVCIGDDEGSFKMWDYRTDRPIHMDLKQCDQYISDLDIDSNLRLVAATSGEGTLTVFNIRAKRMEEPQSELFDSGFQCVRFFENKKKVVVGTEDGVLNIFNNNEWGNISDRFPIRQNNIGLNSIDCMELLDDDNDVFIFGSSDGTLQAASLFPHKPLDVLHRGSASVECLDVNQLTKTIVSVSENNVKIHQYEIVKSESDTKQGKKRKHGSDFFDGLEGGD